MKQKNARLERRQLDGIEAMVDDGRANGESEALRLALDAGLSQLGYPNGGRQKTWLQWFTGELSKVMLFLTVGWMAATLFFPVQFQYVTVYLIGATFGVVGVDRVLAALEPGVSEWATTMFGKKVRG